MDAVRDRCIGFIVDAKARRTRSLRVLLASQQCLAHCFCRTVASATVSAARGPPVRPSLRRTRSKLGTTAGDGHARGAASAPHAAPSTLRLALAVGLTGLFLMLAAAALAPDTVMELLPWRGNEAFLPSNATDVARGCSGVDTVPDFAFERCADAASCTAPIQQEAGLLPASGTLRGHSISYTHQPVAAPLANARLGDGAPLSSGLCSFLQFRGRLASHRMAAHGWGRAVSLRAQDRPAVHDSQVLVPNTLGLVSGWEVLRPICNTAACYRCCCTACAIVVMVHLTARQRRVVCCAAPLVSGMLNFTLTALCFSMRLNKCADCSVLDVLSD